MAKTRQDQETQMLVNANSQRLKRQQEETEYNKKQNELAAIQIQ